MKTTATNKKVRELMGMITAETLVPQPDFQRRLVWTDRHKQLFIETVLDELPFPEIFLCDGEVDLDSGAGKQLIVDGQQRITTLYQYFTASDDLKLGQLSPYKDLPDSKKKIFLDYSVVVRDLGALSDEEIREVFRRMNSTNYSLNAMEVNNARYDGALKKTAEAMSAWGVLDRHRVFNAVDVRRMTDVRWCLDVLVTVMSGYFSRSEAHQEFLEMYNDEFPDGAETTERLSRTLTLLDQLNLEEKSRAWQKNDLFTLTVEIYRLNPDSCHDKAGLADALRAFFEDVDRVAERNDPQNFESARQYHTDVISGSNERARRIRRGDIVREIASPFFKAPEATSDQAT